MKEKFISFLAPIIRDHIVYLFLTAVLIIAAILSPQFFKPANLLDADLGGNQFDAVLTGQITHYLTEAQNASLFRRIYSALLPNGVFVIDCPMAMDEPAETTSLLALVSWADSGGAAHSFEMYRAWLSDSGFGQIKQLSERWVVAIK